MCNEDIYVEDMSSKFYKGFSYLKFMPGIQKIEIKSKDGYKGISYYELTAVFPNPLRAKLARELIDFDNQLRELRYTVMLSRGAEAIITWADFRTEYEDEA